MSCCASAPTLPNRGATASSSARWEESINGSERRASRKSETVIVAMPILRRGTDRSHSTLWHRKILGLHRSGADFDQTREYAQTTQCSGEPGGRKTVAARRPE